MTSSIRVYDESRGSYVTKLNELEYVNGYIYANVWLSTYVYKINAANGLVIKRWDISTLETAEIAFQNEFRGEWLGDVLNGIAYDSASTSSSDADNSEGSFYLSGKNYHLIFKVQLQ